MNDKEAIMQFVQGLAEALQIDPKQIIEITQQNPKALENAVQTYQQTQDINQAAQTFAQSLKQKAQHGAKLQYIKSLKNQCPEGEELYYYKKGGSVGCGCKKKGGEVVKANMGVVASFKENQKKKQQQNQQQQKPKWTDVKDNELKKLSEKKTLTPQEKQRLQQLRNEFKNSSNTKDYEVEEGKKGMKVEKNCGGSTVIAKFKAKCGAKMKKHEQGGSLNKIPFYQVGTPKGGIKYGYTIIYPKPNSNFQSETFSSVPDKFGRRVEVTRTISPRQDGTFNNDTTYLAQSINGDQVKGSSWNYRKNGKVYIPNNSGDRWMTPGKLLGRNQFKNWGDYFEYLLSLRNK